MKETITVNLKEDIGVLNKPIMVVGLPGVGHIGKFAADYLAEYLEAEPIIDIISPHFPPQVLINEDSTISIMKNMICVAKTEKNDIVFLIGDNQSTSPQGHYELCDIYSDIAINLGVERIYTLGGYPIPMLSEPQVIGVATTTDIFEKLKEAGVEIRPSEPSGGIAGTSGLLLAFAQHKGIEAACLMGTTTGYIVDIKCSKVVLNVLGKIIGIDIPEDALNEKIEEMEKIAEQFKREPPEEFESQMEEDLAYFG